MAGITTLYFAILQTPFASLLQTLSQSPTPQQLVELVCPPLRFPAAWAWLAYSLRDSLPALPPIAHLISVWIEILGAEAVQIFGVDQMRKISDSIVRDGLEGGKIKGDSEAARQRLGLLLEDWRSTLKAHPARNWT